MSIKLYSLYGTLTEWENIVIPDIEFRKYDGFFDHTGSITVRDANIILDRTKYRKA